MIIMDSKAQLIVDVNSKVAQGKVSVINATKLLNRQLNAHTAVGLVFYKTLNYSFILFREFDSDMRKAA
jgi:hypothetical protein